MPLIETASPLAANSTLHGLIAFPADLFFW